MQIQWAVIRTNEHLQITVVVGPFNNYDLATAWAQAWSTSPTSVPRVGCRVVAMYSPEYWDLALSSSHRRLD